MYRAPSHTRQSICSDRALGGLLFIVVCSFFWQLTSFEFINLDDPVYVTANPMIQEGLSLKGIQWALTTFTMGHWHPLTWVSHMIDVSLFGMQPFGHHLSSLVLFAASAPLIFMLLRHFALPREWALLLTLFFVLHPMRLESVAWISERKDVLSFVLGIGSLLFYLRRKLWVCYALYLLSLLAKPTFVSLPLLILAIEVFTGLKSTLRAHLLRLTPLALLATFSSALVILTQSQAKALKAASLWERLQNTMQSLTMGVIKFFWPLNNAIFYPKADIKLSATVFSLVLLVTISMILWVNRKRLPVALLGWLWFVIAALPTSGLIPIGGQAYADRWTLLPHVGLILILSSFLGKLRPTNGRLVLMALPVFLIGWASQIELPHWQNSEAIFSHALKVTKNNFLAHNNLGKALVDRGALDQAHSHYQQAVRIHPNYAPALNNLGSSLARSGQYKKAQRLFMRATKSDPSMVSARYNTGLVLLRQANYTESLVVWIELLARAPDYTKTRTSLRSLKPQLSQQCQTIDWERVRSISMKYKEGLATVEDRSLVDELLGQGC